MVHRLQFIAGWLAALTLRAHPAPTCTPSRICFTVMLGRQPFSGLRMLRHTAGRFERCEEGQSGAGGDVRSHRRHQAATRALPRAGSMPLPTQAAAPGTSRSPCEKCILEVTALLHLPDFTAIPTKAAATDNKQHQAPHRLPAETRWGGRTWGGSTRAAAWRGSLQDRVARKQGDVRDSRAASPHIVAPS